MIARRTVSMEHIIAPRPFTLVHFERLGHTESQVKEKLEKMLDYAVKYKVIQQEDKKEWSDPERLMAGLAVNNNTAYQLQTQFRMRILTDSLPNMRSQWGIRSDLVRSLPFSNSRILMRGNHPIASTTPEAFIEADTLFDIRLSYLTIGTHEIGTDLKPGHLVENTLVWKACLRSVGVKSPKEIKEYDGDEIGADRLLSRAADQYLEWYSDPDVLPFREFRAYISQITLLVNMREKENDADFAFYINHSLRNSFVNLEGYLDLLYGAPPKMQKLAQTTHKELVEEARNLLGEERQIVV